MPRPGLALDVKVRGQKTTSMDAREYGTRVCDCVCVCPCVRAHVRVQIPMFNADTESVTSVLPGCVLSVKTLPETNTTWNLFGC